MSAARSVAESRRLHASLCVAGRHDPARWTPNACEPDRAGRDWTKLTARIDQAVLSDDSGDVETLSGRGAASPDRARRKLARASGLRGCVHGLATGIQPVGVRQPNRTTCSTRRRHSSKPRSRSIRNSAEALALLGSVYGVKIAKSSIRGNACSVPGRAARLLMPPNWSRTTRACCWPAASASSTRRRCSAAPTRKPKRTHPPRLTAFGVEPAGQAVSRLGAVRRARLARPDVRQTRRQGRGASGIRTGLAIAPNSGWVRYVLLPALTK